MKKLIFAIIAIAFCSGCFLITPFESEPDNIENILTIAGSRDELRAAIIKGASRRGWMATDKSEDTIRCVLLKRSHKVVVDIKMLDESHFSIIFVSSNVRNGKYYQWVDNLRNDIQRSLSVSR